MSKVRLSAYDDFQILMRAGAAKMLLNLASGSRVYKGISKHLSKAKKKSCTTNPNVDLAERSLCFIYENLQVKGLKDVLTGQYNSKSLFEHELANTEYEESKCLVPDGWVIVTTEFEKGKTTYKIFSSWIKDDQWRISSGDNGFDNLVDFGSFFIWKQRSGAIYKLIKQRSGELSMYARDILLEKVLEPANDLEQKTTWMDCDDLHHAIAMDNDIRQLEFQFWENLPRNKGEDIERCLSNLFEAIGSQETFDETISLFTPSLARRGS